MPTLRNRKRKRKASPPRLLGNNLSDDHHSSDDRFKSPPSSPSKSKKTSTVIKDNSEDHPSSSTSDRPAFEKELVKLRAGQWSAEKVYACSSVAAFASVLSLMVLLLCAGVGTVLLPKDMISRSYWFMKELSDGWHLGTSEISRQIGQPGSGSDAMKTAIGEAILTLNHIPWRVIRENLDHEQMATILSAVNRAPSTIDEFRDMTWALCVTFRRVFDFAADYCLPSLKHASSRIRVGFISEEHSKCDDTNVGNCDDDGDDEDEDNDDETGEQRSWVMSMAGKRVRSLLRGYYFEKKILPNLDLNSRNHHSHHHHISEPWEKPIVFEKVIVTKDLSLDSSSQDSVVYDDDEDEDMGDDDEYDEYDEYDILDIDCDDNCESNMNIPLRISSVDTTRVVTFSRNAWHSHRNARELSPIWHADLIKVTTLGVFKNRRVNEKPFVYRSFNPTLLKQINPNHDGESNHRLIQKINIRQLCVRFPLLDTIEECHIFEPISQLSKSARDKLKLNKNLPNLNNDDNKNAEEESSSEMEYFMLDENNNHIVSDMSFKQRRFARRRLIIMDQRKSEWRFYKQSVSNHQWSCLFKCPFDRPLHLKSSWLNCETKTNKKKKNDPKKKHLINQGGSFDKGFDVPPIISISQIYIDSNFNHNNMNDEGTSQQNDDHHGDSHYLRLIEGIYNLAQSYHEFGHFPILNPEPDLIFTKSVVQSNSNGDDPNNNGQNESSEEEETLQLRLFKAQKPDNHWYLQFVAVDSLLINDDSEILDELSPRTIPRLGWKGASESLRSLDNDIEVSNEQYSMDESQIRNIVAIYRSDHSNTPKCNINDNSDSAMKSDEKKKDSTTTTTATKQIEGVISDINHMVGNCDNEHLDHHHDHEHNEEEEKVISLKNHYWLKDYDIYFRMFDSSLNNNDSKLSTLVIGSTFSLVNFPLINFNSDKHLRQDCDGFLKQVTLLEWKTNLETLGGRIKGRINIYFYRSEDCWNFHDTIRSFRRVNKT